MKRLSNLPHSVLPGPSGPCVLDVSRLVSRLPRQTFTGIDRVEHAYLRFCLTRQEPSFGLVRTRLGYLLLDRAGLKALVRQCDLAAKGQAEDGAMALLRRVCFARCSRLGLPFALRRMMPAGGWYLNVGHSNLGSWGLRSAQRAGLRIAVLVHDVLPLDHPEYMRADTVPRFARKMNAVARFADLVIVPTADVLAHAQAHLARRGDPPAFLTAPLGVSSAAPCPAEVPPALSGLNRMFLTVGTLEPRKNHALLLNLWEALAQELPAADMPHLVIAGTRGWHSPEFFRSLEQHSLYGHRIHEVSGLSDGAISALYTQAEALLFPSLAEGTGLPPIEAAAHGCPVISADLPVYRETLGSLPVYLSPVDMYVWLRIIKQYLAGSGPNRPLPPFEAPTWQDHFARVFPDG